jgi:hypothetical protein
MSASIINQTAVIQAVIDQGRGIAAAIAGEPFGWFRPSSAAFPLAAGNRLGTAMVLLEPGFLPKFNRPALYGKPLYEAIMDATLTAVGDYLIAADGTAYFIISQDSLLPVAVVACNRELNVLRAAGATGVGAQSYGGDITANETPLMQAWPASVLTKSRGELGSTGLADDVKLPWSEVLVPYCGTDILFDDVLIDENGLRYLVSATERTVLGWRLMAVQQTP